MQSTEKSFDHSIFFLLDGFRPDVLRQLVTEGKLPNISQLFFENGTQWTGTTVFPSTTGPAYLPYVTGCYPGTCNVPGIRWVDRQHFSNGNWNRKGTRSYVGYESMYFNDDIDQNAKTLFEFFRIIYRFTILSIGVFLNLANPGNCTPCSLFLLRN